MPGGLGSLFSSGNLLMLLSATMFMVGLILGGVIAKKRGVVGGSAKARKMAELLKADAIGILIDAGSGEGELVPLYRAGPNFYIEFSEAEAEKAPNLVTVPANATPVFEKTLRKPMFISLGVNPMYIANDPKTLLTIGIHSLALTDTPELDRSENPREAFLQLYNKLLEKADIVTGKIDLGPDTKIGIAISIKNLIRALTNYVLSLSVASVTSIRNKIEEARKYKEMQLKIMKEKRMRLRTWAIVIIMLALAAVLIISTIKGGAPKPPTPRIVHPGG